MSTPTLETVEPDAERTERPASTTRLTLQRNGAEAFPAWLAAIEAARHEVLLEMYWWASDKIGRRFAEALERKAREGLDVYLLYDAIGCLGTDRAMFDALERAGAKVLEYHPIAPWRQRFRLAAVTRRDHRKLLVCDARVAFTGGINICDQSAPREEGGEAWRDDAVQVEGPAVAELRALFYDNWCALKGPPARRLGAVGARNRAQVSEALRAQLGIELSCGVQVLGHTAFGADVRVRNLYVRHIRAARDHILIANAYFLPDWAVRRALERAARRGVEVRVLVPRTSDVPSVGYASRAGYARLLRAGVRIHEWVDGMLHAKTALIGRWATVGSYNLDYRSLRYNLEVNVATEDPAFARALEASLRADLAQSEELDPARWAQRPWTEKLLERLHWFIRKIL